MRHRYEERIRGGFPPGIPLKGADAPPTDNI